MIKKGITGEIFYAIHDYEKAKSKCIKDSD